MSNKIKKNLKDETNIILEQMKKEFAEVNKQMNQRFAEVNKQMNQRFAEVNKQMDQRFAEVNNQMKKELKQIKEKLVEHDKKFEEMHRALIIIEDQVTNKIPALFDGYNANHELYEGLEKRVTELEEKESFNSIKISILEDKLG